MLCYFKKVINIIIKQGNVICNLLHFQSNLPNTGTQIQSLKCYWLRDREDKFLIFKYIYI